MLGDTRNPTATAVTRPRSSWWTTSRREAIWAYFFLAPSLVGLLVFVSGPILASFGLSLTDWDLAHAPHFIGTANYVNLTQDEIFWASLRNTTFYVVIHTPLSVCFALVLALALNQKLRGITFFRALFYLPTVCSTVAITMVWWWIYNPDFGILNWFLGLFGIDGPNWLGSSHYVLWSIVFMATWQGVGYGMVIFLAGLQGVDDTFYEAAEIDGANRWQKFRHITLPLISPTTFFVIVLSVLNGYQVFTQMYVMTQGGPGHASYSLVLYLYQNAWSYVKMGYASALAWIIFAIVLLFTLIQFRLQRHWVHYG